ncbi:hypothetical protein AZE42_09842 [Rhizopogon vesiculosus]|uniref:Uncharacterized protein n=1 Tax=Rhizopogon vesiculosus TaxID=180088 RepID=A0A1J8QWV1_9AGAM|nr:hypothetical protein AZE42_09842 [Rhizopogon vesiculosus]
MSLSTEPDVARNILTVSSLKGLY